MRRVYAMLGAIIVVLGAIAVVTGDFTVHGAWVIALALAALGVAGLVATATAVSR